jgi:hypothetical protein
MKKQLLTLTICLALTASSALASCPVKSNETAQPATKGCPCAVSTPVDATLTKEQLIQKFEERMAKRREALYCKLGLTQKQKVKAEELDKQNKAEAMTLMDKVHQEKSKLRDLKSKKVCPVEIYKQKQQLKAAKKALHKHFIASEKSFETILTKEQLTKFKAIRTENKAKMKKHFSKEKGKREKGKEGCKINK